NKYNYYYSILHCALSSYREQSTLRVFLTYSPRSNTTPSITLLSFEFTTGNTILIVSLSPRHTHTHTLMQLEAIKEEELSQLINRHELIEPLPINLYGSIPEKLFAGTYELLPEINF